MTDEDALLRAIREQPDEDTPRLAFADWLSEEGGPVNSGWATLIRAQVRLSAGAGDETSVLLQRVRMFTSGYWREQIAGRLGMPTLSQVRLDAWARGFPDHVSGRYPAVRAIWQRLINRIPFGRLRVTAVDDDSLEELLSWPELARRKSLDLTSWDYPKHRSVIGERGATALATCPAVAGMEEVALGELGFNSAVIETLLASASLPQVKSLRLRRSFRPLPPDPSLLLQLREHFGPKAVI